MLDGMKDRFTSIVDEQKSAAEEEVEVFEEEMETHQHEQELQAAVEELFEGDYPAIAPEDREAVFAAFLEELDRRGGRGLVDTNRRIGPELEGILVGLTDDPVQQERWREDVIRLLHGLEPEHLDMDEFSFDGETIRNVQEEWSEYDTKEVPQEAQRPVSVEEIFDDPTATHIPPSLDDFSATLESLDGALKNDPSPAEIEAAKTFLDRLGISGKAVLSADIDWTPETQDQPTSARTR